MMVHQGGVGTTGQALRAGIPMLVVPLRTINLTTAHALSVLAWLAQ
jgi:hypothetical protein